MRTSCAVSLADDRRERLLGAPGDEQHGGRSAAREQRGDGRRRLGVGVRKPVVHRRPADLRREAGEQEHEGDERWSRARRRARPSEPPREPAEPALGRPARGARSRAARTPSPSDVRTRYFQPASSARALPLKPTSSAEAAVVASIRSHATPRLPASGTARRTAQKARERRVVEARPALRADELRVAPRRGRRVTTSTLASPTTPITPTRSPPAASTTSQSPATGSSAVASATTASAIASERRRCPRPASPSAGDRAARRDGHEHGRERRHARSRRRRATRG